MSRSRPTSRAATTCTPDDHSALTAKTSRFFPQSDHRTPSRSGDRTTADGRRLSSAAGLLQGVRLTDAAPLDPQVRASEGRWLGDRALLGLDERDNRLLGDPSSGRAVATSYSGDDVEFFWRP